MFCTASVLDTRYNIRAGCINLALAETEVEGGSVGNGHLENDSCWSVVASLDQACIIALAHGRITG